MKLIDSCRELLVKYREFIMYGIFGVLTTIISWASYALFVHLGVEINISNILSWICGVTFAFVTNKWFVFLSKDVTVKVVFYEAGSFVGARLFTGVVAFVLFPILYYLGLNQSLFGTDGFLAKIVTSIIEIILNWLLSKYIVFRKGRINNDSSSFDEQS